MRPTFTRFCLAAASLALLNATGHAQTYLKQIPGALPSARAELSTWGIGEGLFRSQLRLRSQTLPDGSRIALLTNLGPTPLYYTSNEGGVPVCSLEDWHDGHWFERQWQPAADNVPGTVQERSLLPGQSRMLLLTFYLNKDGSRDQQRRCWLLISSLPETERNRRFASLAFPVPGADPRTLTPAAYPFLAVALGEAPVALHQSFLLLNPPPRTVSDNALFRDKPIERPANASPRVLPVTSYGTIARQQ